MSMNSNSSPPIRHPHSAGARRNAATAKILIVMTVALAPYAMPAQAQPPAEPGHLEKTLDLYELK